LLRRNLSDFRRLLHGLHDYRSAQRTCDYQRRDLQRLHAFPPSHQTDGRETGSVSIVAQIIVLCGLRTLDVAQTIVFCGLWTPRSVPPVFSNRW
jgi:hypothetical protein